MDSLAPLAELTSLRWLVLASLRVTDGSLRPLGNLQNLQTLRIPNWYATEEYAYLAARVPHAAESEWPIWVSPLYGPCSRCGHAEMAKPVGVNKRSLCPACQPKKIDEFMAKFAADVRRFASGAF